MMSTKSAKFITEMYGTTMLVLVVACCVAFGSPLAPLAIGFTLAALIFMGGHISGGHYNPAVSLALCLSSKAQNIKGTIRWKDLHMYVAAQLLGGIIGGVTGSYLAGSHVSPSTGFEHSVVQSFFAEVIFTQALCYVVLCVAGTKMNAGNQYYGLAIGITVLAGACSLGTVSGACFNPAVGTGLLVASAIGGVEGAMNELWLYWAASLLGAALASALFRLTNACEFPRPPK